MAVVRAGTVGRLKCVEQQRETELPHTIKAGKAELTISSARLVRYVDRMARWSPERRAYAHKAAEARLGGKHPRKRDAAISLASAEPRNA